MKTKINYSSKSRQVFTRQQGAALIVSLVIVSVMSILGLNAVKQNVVQERMANSYRFGVESLNHAEAGIEDALAAIKAGDLHVNGYQDELDPNGDGNGDDTWTITLLDQNTGVNYNVIMVDDNDGDGDPNVDSNDIVLLMAQGIGSNGTVRTVEIAVSQGTGSSFSLETAILTEEDLYLDGNPNLMGSIKDIHSNRDITITSTITTAGEVSASGTITGAGNISGGGTSVESVPQVAIPEINPADFEQYVDYKLRSDGKIYDGNDNFLADADGVAYGGYIFDSANGYWGVVRNPRVGDLLKGDLYFMGDKGNLRFDQSPGSNGNKYIVSIMTDGYLDISGNPYFSNYKDPADPVGFQNILFLSKTDISISGNYNQDNKIQGIIAAREQIDISGNPNVSGSIIAGGQDSTSNYVTKNSITGNPNIEFDGIQTPWENPTPGDPVRLSWRQLGIAQGAGAFAIF